MEQELLELQRELEDLKYELRQTNIHLASLVKALCEKGVIDRTRFLEVISAKQFERYPEDF